MAILLPKRAFWLLCSIIVLRWGCSRSQIRLEPRWHELIRRCVVGDAHDCALPGDTQLWACTLSGWGAFRCWPLCCLLLQPLL